MMMVGGLWRKSYHMYKMDTFQVENCRLCCSPPGPLAEAVVKKFKSCEALQALESCWRVSTHQTRIL